MGEDSVVGHFEARVSALEVCYENALYKFTFEIDIDRLTVYGKDPRTRYLFLSFFEFTVLVPGSYLLF